MEPTNDSPDQRHHRFMAAAMELAEDALTQGEFPVGCVITCNDRIVATGARTHSGQENRNELDHAEISALRELSRLRDPMDTAQMALYCTLEPCLMCYAAIMLSGIGQIVYAYEDVMGGGTSCDREKLSPLYRDHPISVISGIMRGQSIDLFKRFFSDPDNTYWKGSPLAQHTLSRKTGTPRSL